MRQKEQRLIQGGGDGAPQVFLGEVSSGILSTQVVVKELKASASVHEQVQFLEEAQPYRWVAPGIGRCGWRRRATGRAGRWGPHWALGSVIQGKVCAIPLLPDPPTPPARV